MKDNCCKKGFTLIELLVVVLIIGILASVALPKYQKAVEKSKAMQAIAMIKSVQQAQLAAYLANGDFASKFDQLPLDIPWTGHKVTGLANYTKDTRASDDWSLEWYDDYPNGTHKQLYSVRLRGPYKGAGFVLEFYGNKQRKIQCIERVSNANPAYPSSKAAGSYCQKIIGGTYIPGGVANRYYSLPY